MIIDTLRHCRLFDNLTDEQIERVATLVEEHHYRKGDYVCREGAWGDSMYIIDAGEVKIIKKLDVEDTWDITTLRHGDFFGEVALVDGSPRTASCMALNNTTVLELYGRDFKRLLQSRDDLAHAMMESLLRTLINRIRATDDLVARFMIESNPAKRKEGANMREAITRMMVGR